MSVISDLHTTNGVYFKISLHKNINRRTNSFKRNTKKRNVEVHHYHHFKKKNTSNNLIFTSLLDGSVISLAKISSKQILEYSMNNIDFNEFTTKTEIILNNGEKIYVRGILNGENTNSDYTQFIIRNKVKVSGNISSILNYKNLKQPLSNYCCAKLFYNCFGLIDASELLLHTNTSLTESCYRLMFYGCINLEKAPALPAIILAPYCYQGMFGYCTSLIEAPVLPATTLTLNCYRDMFYGDIKLARITCLAKDASMVGVKSTYDWLHNVSDNGKVDGCIFYKHPNMNSWSKGKHGIPLGWIVKDVVLAE